ncbi:hypothetical protein QJS66_09235 [Kocuria rhizophila]|nr:hypothetical protein QJS66_09235 [Kocuria rhizophila]
MAAEQAEDVLGTATLGNLGRVPVHVPGRGAVPPSEPVHEPVVWRLWLHRLRARGTVGISRASPRSGGQLHGVRLYRRHRGGPVRATGEPAAAAPLAGLLTAGVSRCWPRSSRWAAVPGDRRAHRGVHDVAQRAARRDERRLRRGAGSRAGPHDVL